MGACTSDNDVVIERSLSSLITKELNKDKTHVIKHKKILFLGSGGTGKSTVFKQLRQIHGAGFSDEDKESFIPHIHAQIVNEMKAAINVYIDYNHRKQQREKKENECDENDELIIFDAINLESPDLTNMQCADKMRNYIHNKKKHEIDNDIIDTLQILWNEPVIKEIYDKRNITKIETSSAHFWNKLDEIKNTSYLPTEQDIILCRLQTIALHELTFPIKNDVFNIIDVGGQRSQRRKWIHCFEYVVAVIFIASLSCYDEILYEDSNVNSMVDQLELFDNVCNNHSLSKTSMILFLNKKDLFKEKYIEKRISLGKSPAFKRYKKEGSDPFDYDKAIKYIQFKFTKLNKTETRQIFTHSTCATDKNNIQKVFADVQLIVISNALEDGGYMDFEE